MNYKYTLEPSPKKYKYNKTIEPKKKSSAKQQDIINTPTEIIVKKLASKNSQILNLIKVYELTDANGTDIIV
jgi:hypothetical protein|tara:strand:- start:135 stop:350 length:216 start_codon:yes stop_codon:yes gene_type:complete